MRKVRIRFRKLGRARFISHLDLNRCMARAVRRAGVPVWYTEGFNPHPYLTFALPLSIFYGSVCEAMDVKLDGNMGFEEIKSRLSAQMPEGIEIYDVCEPVMKYADIAFARYKVMLEFDGVGKDALGRAFKELSGRDALEIERPTKHGTRIIDILPYLADVRTSADISDGRIELGAVLPAGQNNVNPSAFALAFGQYAGLTPDIFDATRTEIYNGALEPFK